MATLRRLDRQKIVIWRRPIMTSHYFVRELCLVFWENFLKLLRNKLLLGLLALFLSVVYTLCVIPGPHSPLFAYVEKKAAWCAYWIFLGVLSSVGLGTGSVSSVETKFRTRFAILKVCTLSFSILVLTLPPSLWRPMSASR